MRKFSIVLLLAVLFTACEEKDIKLYPSFEESTIVNVNTTGEFEEYTTIYASQINDAVNDLELEEDGEIESVAVEGIWMVVKPLSGNTATSATVNVTIKAGDQDYKPLLKNYVVDIPSVETTYYFPEYLDKNGIALLKARLNNIVVDGILTDDIDLKVSGNTTPENSTVKLEIEIFVKGSVVFVQTVELI
ncbi:hypothetical protein [Plebeiibacterium sediminum]|uniref:Uncharacterized protein n=1 Tax=Plebeiibacterium sediminum TaxID=2992112 RepID=A0AAE3SGT4_9BACT|nr:hypothetical protein [Plebeiobacterium sediminum]MCW3788818.1 hypothetical protein [Plebeiobacterium sediminum]